MVIYLEKEEQQRHSYVELYDSTAYVQGSAFRKQKKNIRPDELMQASDFRAGMKVSLFISYYQRSNRTVVERMALEEAYYGRTHLKGIFERLDGDRATIDGQSVVLQLDKGKAIDGLEGWRGKKFTSFDDMQLGAQVEIYGERRPDGIVYASRGTMRPIEMGKEDFLLRRATDNELRVTQNVLNIANAWKFRLVANTQAEAYVSSVGWKLVPPYLKELPPDHPDYVAFKFYLANDASFNASSFPNGAVVLHSGLLRQLDNEAQLAAILGHEIAHITQKHHARRYRSNQNWEAVQTFGALVAAGTGDATPLAVIQMARDISLTTFSQAQEMQADRIGMHYMTQAGYDPREVVAVWKKLAEADREETHKAQEQQALQWIRKSYQQTDETAEKRVAAKPLPGPREQPLLPSHPSPKDRFTHVNFLVSTAYYNTDFNALNRDGAKFQQVRRLVGGGGSTPTKLSRKQ